MGVAFEVIPSRIDEKTLQDPDPIKMVQCIAKAKAEAVAVDHNGVIIAADTFAIYNGHQYGKPSNSEDASRMLRELSGQTGEAVTGICIINTHRNEKIVDYRSVTMQCVQLTDEEIDYYVHNKPVTEWAAAYNPLDELSSRIFRPVGTYEYKTEYYGLPVDIVAEALGRVGIVVNLSKFQSNPISQ